MNRRNDFGALLMRPIRALKRNIGPAREGKALALHRMRVASRRLREVFPVAAAGSPGVPSRKAVRRVRRLTRSLGPVRELDVVLLILKKIHLRQAALRPAVDLMRGEIEAEQRGRRDEMRHRISSADLEKVGRKASVLAAALVEAPARKRWYARLALCLKRRSDRLRAAIEDAGAIYLPDRLHRVRVAMKKLRYALELANDTGVRAPLMLKSLKRAQGTLGRLNDIEVLISQVQEVRASRDVDDATTAMALDSLVRALANECRQLHGRYIASREELLDLCRRARREVVLSVVEKQRQLPRAARAMKVTLARSQAAEVGERSAGRTPRRG